MSTELAGKERVSKLLPSFLASAQETFETMVFMPIQPGAPFPKGHGMPQGFISGTISLSGEDQCGNLSLVFPLDVARMAFCKMMGMPDGSEVQSQELNDVVGELSNMVAGGAKSHLQDQNINFKIGLPSVVVGEGHYLEPPKDAQTVVVELKAEGGSFFLELAF